MTNKLALDTGGVCVYRVSFAFKNIKYFIILFAMSRGCANTTITVLRVPASVSEYGWMLENSHFVYMWSRESPFQTGFRPIRFLNCIGVHKILNILKCKHGWAHEYFLCYGWNFLNRSILCNISMVISRSGNSME